MSTHSIIAIKRANGTRTSIYCHFDGYIEGVGATLQLAYNTAEKVEELLALGDLSRLAYYTEHEEGRDELSVCRAYHRDCGEAFRQSDSDDEEYCYTFDEVEGLWIVNSYQRPSAEHERIKDMFHLGCMWLRGDSLLLEKLLQAKLENYWNDDEFATKENLHDTFIEKAREGITEAHAKFWKDTY